MSLRGYSLRLVDAIKAANPRHPGVRLGKYCIAKGIPVNQMAKRFGVSRMTMYTWFTGTGVPRKDKIKLIEELLSS
jgi:transcriptional regulator with XRE-family HTH domain